MALTVMSPVAEDLARALIVVVRSTSSEWKADRGMVTSADPALAGTAWFCADLYEHAIVFTLLAPPEVTLPAHIYATYHGRMVQTLLNRFAFMIERITVKPPPPELPVLAPRKQGSVITDGLKCMQ